MITVRCKINSYNKESNTCTAVLLNGDIINIDPFVSCAIPLSDDEAVKGSNIVGNTYLLTIYTVHIDYVIPHENGMILIDGGERG